MVLKVVTTATATNGTVTIIGGTANQINVSPNPITTTGNIALANITTAGTFGNASTVAQVVIDVTGRVTTAANVGIVVASGNVTGLGTMATQNANAVAITGGTINSVAHSGGTFASANITSVAATFPNSYLSNSTATLGNSAITLGSTTSSVGNLSLSNVNILSGSGNVTNLFQGYTATTAANATTTLTNASTYWQKITASGTNTQTFQLPDATTLPNGAAYVFDNDAGGNVTINDGAAGLVDTLVPGSVDFIFLESNATVAGLWGKYSWLPAYVNWGTSTADFGNVAVSNVVISGGQINVTTVNMTANTASNVTYTSATMQLVPAGYINYDLNGTLVKIPYYNA